MTTQGQKVAYIRVSTQEQNTESQQEILQPQATFYILTSNKTIVKTFYINSENALSH